MRRLTTRYQMFGDLNRQLNRIRARMNQDVIDRYNELLERKRTNKEDDANAP